MSRVGLRATAIGISIAFSAIWLYQQYSLFQALTFPTSYWDSEAARMYMYGKKEGSRMCVRERKRNLLCSPAVILSKNKTNTLPLPSNHPPCSANIQAKLHSTTSPSLSLSLAHSHTQPPGKKRKGELHHPSITAVAAAKPWKETCRYYEISTG